MGDAGPPAPCVDVFDDVHALPRLTRYGPGRFSDLFASDPSSSTALVGGVWDADDAEHGDTEFFAEYDEMKYVIRGGSIWQDVPSGKRFSAGKGSLIWFPKGSKTIRVSSKSLSTLYVECTHREPVPKTDLKGSWSSKLDALYEAVMNTYVQGNPKSQKLHQEAVKYLPGGNTRSVLYYHPFPIVLTSGRDCHVTSLDGVEYLDFVSEFSAALFGHSHPEILASVQETMKRGFNLGGSSTEEVELAAQLVHRFKSIEKIRFTNSGTEANTMALQIAIAFTGRKKVLAFSRGYHGGFLSFGAAKDVLNLPYDFVLGQYNETVSNDKLMSEEIAAIILEPMQGAGGMIPATTEFLRYVRQAATRIGAVLIFDEIITSRLHINGLQGYHDIHPDITTLAKYLGGGFGFGAFGGRADVMAVLDPSRSFHSGTYNNNTFSMAAGVAAGKILTAEKIAFMNALGDCLRDGINDIMRRKELPYIQATGFGSAVGLQFYGPCPTRLKDAFFFHLLSKRIYVGKRGFLSLNLMHRQEHIDYTLVEIERFVQQIFG